MITFDEYLKQQDTLADTFGDAGYEETYRRCPMCGDKYPADEFDTYKGQDMCPDCIDIERTNDATEAFTPDFAELFNVS